MSRASGKSTFIVNRHHPCRTPGAPSPQDEIDVADARAGGKAAASRARKSLRDQAIRQGLRCGDTACEHLCFPCGAGEVGIEHSQHPTPLFVQSIEHGLRIDLVGAQVVRMEVRVRFVAMAAVELRRHDREQRTTGRSTLTTTAPRRRRRPKPR